MDTTVNEKDATWIESLKELDDIEFEIMFIDNICKKLKSLDKPDIKSNTLLFMYMSVIDSIKRYKELAIEANREIKHRDAIDLIINKGTTYLTEVANDTTEDIYASKAIHAAKELSAMHDLFKGLLLMLKSDLVELPKYNYLKQGCDYK